MTNIKPIHEVIKFNQTRADDAREWAGVKAQEAKPAQPKRPTFGKKASR